MDTNGAPIFSAVSNFTHHLYLILRCIGFASKAAIQITPQGIRFSAEDGRVMQGLAFLDKTLFANYVFNPVPSDNGVATDTDVVEEELDTAAYPRFLISLTALIETLQIFGLSDAPADSNPISNPITGPASNAFSTPALLLNRTCTISYLRPGSPLCITLSEAGVTTTYSTNPSVLTITASPKKAPYFALSASGGPFGESTVEFSIDKEPDALADPSYKSLNNNGSSRQPKRGKLAPSVAETFLVHPPSSRARVRQSYRFALVRKALRAMAAASKVSIRGDSQGVLSIQFMIELGEAVSDPHGSTKTQQVPGLFHWLMMKRTMKEAN
uniref:DNA repair exonuclease rad1 n=1 Tax=Coccidioides posadasii RMSCC 3488 TaxID=454284 RepID=A0A0J6I3K4_COCPO|nr:hypothetical protein CPAG_02298 [Coccidioides posadasii RMSCC 3488]